MLKSLIAILAFSFSVLVQAADANTLDAVLDAQAEETKARYVYRHPKETLEFFGIEPGMSVVEALPGGGWYTKILLPYLGADGKLIGANYPDAIWPMFGFFNEEQIKERLAWIGTWPHEANGWRDDNSAAVSAFVFGSMPEGNNGTADAVLFIRALHNLNRFEKEHDFLTLALKDAFNSLKPGGILGVVQHHARDNMPDAWADGSQGYLKKEALIEAIKNAGFEFVASSDINVNPNDKPAEEDFVWRLPPSYATSKDNPELKAQFTAIGESNRMTLKFRKPE